jgi:hypothetical protein
LMSHLRILVIGQAVYAAPPWRFKNDARGKTPLASHVDVAALSLAPERLASELALANLVIIEQDGPQAQASEKILTSTYENTELPVIALADKRQSRGRPLKAGAYGSARLSLVFGRYDLSLMSGDKGLMAVLRQAAFDIPDIAQPQSDPVVVGVHRENAEKTIVMEFRGEKKILTPMRAKLIARLTDNRLHGNDLIMQHMFGKKNVGERERGLLRTHASRLSDDLTQLFGHDPLHQEYGVGYKWVGPPIRFATGAMQRDILAL